ncbi:hypothetical protein AAFF_G00394860 [Aldrovandia affinis]|uniref:Gypsy retrotransposon integrase-like protein 1 n=1 Tax=Aldrovandia affinis TaxID=143900 RepID=A0AAD7SEB8_9TELE|nr:hypothetical protein AAFF_G00394860 [Aldrovandia affinis]
MHTPASQKWLDYLKLKAEILSRAAGTYLAVWPERDSGDHHRSGSDGTLPALLTLGGRRSRAPTPDDGRSQLPPTGEPPTRGRRGRRNHFGAGGVGFSPGKPYFAICSGLLYQIDNHQGEERTQLLVPQVYIPVVLELAHAHILAAHLGAEKTTERLLQRYFWPRIYRAVKDY